jgi:hypothetical protein
MRIRTALSLAAAASLAVGASACSKKEEATKAPPTAEAAPGGSPKPVDTSKLSAPKLFAHIPADTPYVFASFEPIPAEFWTLMGDTMKPEMEKAFDQLLAQPADSPPKKFVAGILRDLRGNLTADGVKKVLGISTDFHFAVHGIGVVPVFRLELADAKALTATIEKHSKESGFTLPIATSNGKPYWRVPDGDTLLVAAILDDQLVVSGGPAPLIEKALPQILGVEKPTPSMADGGALKETIARHGLAAYGAGFVDTAKLASHIVALKTAEGKPPPPACPAQLTALGTRFPKLVFGYDAVSTSRIGMRVVLEVEPELLGRLKALQVEVPGLAGGKLAQPALFAMGGGIDIPKARQLGMALGRAMVEFGSACGAADMVEDATEMQATMSQPLPPGLDKVRGGLAVVLGGEMTQQGPRNIDGFAVIATDDPGALLDVVYKQAPPQLPKVARDGKFHDVVPAGAMPGVGAVQAAVMEKAIVVRSGTQAVAASEAALEQKGASPLFFLTYDYGRIMSTVAAMSPQGIPGVSPKLLAMFGQSTMSASVGDNGVAIAIDMEIRK